MAFSPVRVFPVRSARKSFADPHETLNLFTDKGKTQDLLTGSRLGKTTTSYPKQLESSGFVGKENDSKQARPESRGKGKPSDSIGSDKNKAAINLFQSNPDDKKREVVPPMGRKRHSISGPVPQEAPRVQRRAAVNEPVVQQEVAPRTRRPSAHAHRTSFGSIGELFQPPPASTPSVSSSVSSSTSATPASSSVPPTHRRLSSHQLSTALPQGGKFEDTRGFDPSKRHVRRRSQVVPINQNSVEYNILNPPTPVESTYRRQKAPVEQPTHVRARSTPPRQSPSRRPSTSSESDSNLAWHI